MKESAIVTGASKGIGEAVAEILLQEGYIVYGFARDYSSCLIRHEDFHAIQCDLLDTKKLMKHLNEIPADSVKILVNNAGVAWYGLHEEMNTEKIQAMVRTNLEVPMIMSQKYIRALRKNHGMMINIASISGTESSPHGAVYGAAKAGLIHFGRTLFEENRKYGMKVCTIIPDLTMTDLYRNADFKPKEEDGCYLLAEDIAKGVHYILHQREGIDVTELTIRPQFNKIQRKKQ